MANDKRGRKPDWNKRNFIISAVGVMVTAVLGLVASREPGTQNIQDGVENITQNIQGGIRNTTTQTINNILNPTPTHEITIASSATSPTAAIAGPAIEGNSGKALLQAANTEPVTDDPYRHKATSSVDTASEIIGNFPTRQDRDDYALGLEHIAHTHQRLGGFSIYQVVAEGRAVRKQAEAAQEAERQRIERLADAKREEDGARHQAALNAANAERAKEAEHFWRGEPDCLVLDRSSLKTAEDQNFVYATGVVQNWT